MKLRACPVPDDALLQRYVGQGATYTDCFTVEIPQQVSLDQYVSAFYTTPLFRAERLVLTVGMRKRIRDSDIDAMLSGVSENFAFWRVEARGENELLMCDLSGSTRSWFGVQPEATGSTRLFFGSVVVAKEGEPLSKIVEITEGLHIMYSRGLLAAARRRLLIKPTH